MLLHPGNTSPLIFKHDFFFLVPGFCTVKPYYSNGVYRSADVHPYLSYFPVNSSTTTRIVWYPYSVIIFKCSLPLPTLFHTLDQCKDLHGRHLLGGTALILANLNNPLWKWLGLHLQSSTTTVSEIFLSFLVNIVHFLILSAVFKWF